MAQAEICAASRFFAVSGASCVLQPQLNALTSLPRVHVETARQMKMRAAVAFECRAKRGIVGAKANRFEARTVAVTETDLQVRLADAAGREDPHVGKDIARGGVSNAISRL